MNMNELYILNYNMALFKKVLEVIANSGDASDLSAIKKLAKMALTDEMTEVPNYSNLHCSHHE